MELKLTSLEVFILFFQTDAQVLEVLCSSKVPSHTFCTHMHKTPGTMQLHFILRHADAFRLFHCYVWGCGSDIDDGTNLREVVSRKGWGVWRRETERRVDGALSLLLIYSVSFVDWQIEKILHWFQISKQRLWSSVRVLLFAKDFWQQALWNKDNVDSVSISASLGFHQSQDQIHLLLTIIENSRSNKKRVI